MQSPIYCVERVNLMRKIVLTNFYISIITCKKTEYLQIVFNVFDKILLTLYFYYAILNENSLTCRGSW